MNECENLIPREWVWRITQTSERLPRGCGAGNRQADTHTLSISNFLMILMCYLCKILKDEYHISGFFLKDSKPLVPRPGLQKQE